MIFQRVLDPLYPPSMTLGNTAGKYINWGGGGGGGLLNSGQHTQTYNFSVNYVHVFIMQNDEN